jgi:hypothetical protein
MKEANMNERGILEFAKAIGQVDIATGSTLYTGIHLARLYYADFQLEADYYLSVMEKKGKCLYPLYGDDNAIEAIATCLVENPEVGKI